RLHQRLSRRRELDRHGRLDTGAQPARRGALGRLLQLRRLPVFSTHVAGNIAKGVDSRIVSLPLVAAGLIGAVVWDLLTWWWGLPTSSSHALLGGIAGAAIVAKTLK